jgi:predicted ATPase
VPPSGLVTLLFTDIEGSTRAWEAHSEEMKVALARHDEILRDEIERAGGFVFKTVGDAFCAAFRTAPSALAAAVACQSALRAERWPEATPIRVRMALHSGECEERDGDYFGPVVNRTARLEAIAHGEQVLLSGVTAGLLADRLPDGLVLRDLGEHRLKDLGRPEHVFQLGGNGLADAFPPLKSLNNPGLQHNLPEQVSSFVGRRRELDEVRELVAEARLVTLAGPGGVGKTRLALQAGAELLDGSGSGVWFVDLAPISDSSLVASTVAKVLQLREEPGRPVVETLAEKLEDTRMLVVLDNCEHVIEAVATLAHTLLRNCREIRLLATSREPLGIPGEQVYRVPSLPVPREDDDDPQVLLVSESVRLFLERARQQKPGFVLDAGNARTIGRLCRRLDGIPFALELAAARLRSLSVRDLDVHLDKRFRLLTGGSRTALPRQQTLQALIDWSYGLLTPAEQTVLCRLSVFAGGFDVAGAEAVCAGGDVEEFEVLALLDALVDKSLVQADETGGTVRYRLLETIREYGVARLAATGDDQLDRVRRAHRDHYLALAEAAEGHLRGLDEIEWVDRLDTEFDNLRAALAECLADPDPAPGLRLGDALSEFWVIRGYGIEGAETLLTHLARPDAQAPTALRGRALVAAADLVKDYLTDFAAAVAQAEEALAIARAVGDDVLAVKALSLVARIRSRQGDYVGCVALVDEALPIARGLDDLRLAARLLNVQGCALDGLGEDGNGPLEESAELYRRAGDRRGVALAVNNLGLTAMNTGNLEAARRLFGEAVGVMRELGDQQGLAVGALNAGYVAAQEGDAETASRSFHECLDITRRIVARPLLGYAILGLALTATLTGDFERAATLHGAFTALFEQLGAVVETLESRLRDADHAHLRARLGDEAFDRAYQRGMHLPFETALAIATEPDAASAV